MWLKVRRMSLRIKILALAGLVASVAACQGRAPDVPADGPGADAWKAELACSSDGDCNQGESCTGGICQLKRCAAPAHAPAAPLGKSGFLMLNRELVAVTSSTTVEGYSSSDRTFVRAGDTMATSGSIVDVAGGNLTGSRPDAVAIATSGSKDLAIAQGGRIAGSVSVGFAPIAVASGDVDGDGVDEIVAASSGAEFAVCHAQPAGCKTLSLPRSGITDVAVGDVDGDGFAEAVFAVGTTLYVYNFDAATTQQNAVASADVGTTLFRIAAGDLDGSGVDRIVGLEDGGQWVWDHDKLHLFSWNASSGMKEEGSVDVGRDSRDVTVEHLQGEDKAQIALLGASNALHVFGWDGKTTLASAFDSTLSGANDATRLGGADIDGNSPKAKLHGEPQIVPGSTVPVAVLTFPPYSKTYSAAPSSVTLGSSETKSENKSDTVALNLGITIGAGFDLPLIFKASVSASINKTIARTKSFATSVTVGESFSTTAKPEIDGWDTAAVVVSCGCYQQFQYDVEDPGHLLSKDADGKPMIVYIPVGGSTTVWSMRRYNALADALGTLPKMKIPYTLGDVSSYPTEPQRLDGTPIPPEDNVFVDTKSVRVSDSATVSFSLSSSETTTNSTAVSTSISGTIGFGAGPVNVSGTAGITYGTGYDLSFGTSATFSGSVQPIRDDPNTPEDEFADNAYGFTPYVYKQRYLDPQQKESAFYVMVYALGR